MDVVRYRSPEAVRWLELGAKPPRDPAVRRDSLVRAEESVAWGESVKAAAGAVWDFGRGAWASAIHHRASNLEYVLLPDRFEVVRGDRIRVLRYSDVRKITVSARDKVTIQFEGSKLTLQPPAYIVSGRLRVAIGWNRNGIDVPYEMLIDELAARAGVEPEIE